MKNLRLIVATLSVAVFFGGFGASAQTKKLNVAVESLGSLSELISEDDKWSVTELSVSGWLNGKDLVVLREMAGADLYGNPTNGKLSVLDMSGVRIAGYDETDPAKREPYYADAAKAAMYVIKSDDVFPKKLFIRCSSLKEIVLPDRAVSFGGMEGADNIETVKTTLNSINLAVKDNIVFSKDGKTLYYCPPKSSVTVDYTVPAGTEVIAAGAFEYCEALKSVDISDSVKEIGSDAFSYSALETVRIGSGLERIAGYGDKPEAPRPDDFFNPASLALDLPHPFYFAPITVLAVDEANRSFKSADNVLYSKDGTILYFAAQSKSGDFTVPETVRAIAGHAFTYSGLRSVVLPQGLQNFDRPYVFNQCIDLESVVVGPAVEKFDNKVFFFCPALKQVDVSEANPFYRSEDGAVYKKDEFSTLSYVPGALAEYSVPEGTRAVEPGAMGFYNDKLARLTLPATMERIGTPLGYYMISWSEVCCKAKNPPVKFGDVDWDYLFFINTMNDRVLYVPVGSSEVYKKTIWKYGFTDIKEMDFGDMDAVAGTNGITVAGVSGGVRVCGYAGRVEVYAVDGRLVAEAVSDGETLVPLRRGIYLVRAGSKSEKVAVTR